MVGAPEGGLLEGGDTLPEPTWRMSASDATCFSLLLSAGNHLLLLLTPFPPIILPWPSLNDGLSRHISGTTQLASLWLTYAVCVPGLESQHLSGTFGCVRPCLWPASRVGMGSWWGFLDLLQELGWGGEVPMVQAKRLTEAGLC